MRKGNDAILWATSWSCRSPGSANIVRITRSIPESCPRADTSDCDGGNVRNTWWQIGPAPCKRICHAACKSATFGTASHNLCSSANRFSTTSRTSGPNSATPSGHKDDRYHTLVFPVCRRIPACACNFVPKLSYNVRVRLAHQKWRTRHPERRRGVLVAHNPSVPLPILSMDRTVTMGFSSVNARTT